MKFSFQNVLCSPMRRYSFVIGIFALPKLYLSGHLVMQKEQSGGRRGLCVYCQDQTQRGRRAQCLLQLLTTRGVGAGRSLVWGQFLSCQRGLRAEPWGLFVYQRELLSRGYRLFHRPPGNKRQQLLSYAMYDLSTQQWKAFDINHLLRQNYATRRNRLIFHHLYLL